MDNEGFFRGQFGVFVDMENVLFLFFDSTIKIMRFQSVSLFFSEKIESFRQSTCGHLICI